MVSVIVGAYRHEAFIAQAVESVLAQQTDFPFEVLITEDCSPDRTRDIVTNLQRRRPDVIRLFLSEHNLNDNTVTTRAWEAARGKYIATLDGDDYWTDSLKLQKQVEFMERHPDVFICGHAVSLVDAHGRTLAPRADVETEEDRDLSREDLAAGYCFRYASVLFRNNTRLPPHELFNDVVNADSFMFAFFANFGGGYVSREVMAAYRLHPGGTGSTLDARRAADHRNRTLSRIPKAVEGSLRSIAYAKLLAHALREDYALRRKLRQIPYALVMAALYLTPASARYLARRAVRWIFKRGR